MAAVNLTHKDIRAIVKDYDTENTIAFILHFLNVLNEEQTQKLTVAEQEQKESPESLKTIRENIVKIPLIGNDMQYYVLRNNIKGSELIKMSNLSLNGMLGVPLDKFASECTNFLSNRICELRECCGVNSYDSILKQDELKPINVSMYNAIVKCSKAQPERNRNEEEKKIVATPEFIAKLKKNYATVSKWGNEELAEFFRGAKKGPFCYLDFGNHDAIIDNAASQFLHEAISGKIVLSLYEKVNFNGKCGYICAASQTMLDRLLALRARCGLNRYSKQCDYQPFYDNLASKLDDSMLDIKKM